MKIISGGRAVAYIDESYAQIEMGRTLSILGACIFEGSIIQAWLGFRLEHVSEKTFKSSTCFNNKTLKKLFAMLNWATSNFDRSIVVLASHADRDTEKYREQALENMILRLSELGVRDLVVDSRHLPRTKDVYKNDRRDRLVLNGLIHSRKVSRNMRMRHELDNKETFLAAPDLISWATRKHFSGENSKYWVSIKGNVEVIDLRY